MITLKNGTFSIGAEGSYQNWLCRFKDALKGKGKHKLKDFEAFMFGEKIKKAGLEAGLTKERINQDWLEAHNEGKENKQDFVCSDLKSISTK